MLIKRKPDIHIEQPCDECAGYGTVDVLDPSGCKTGTITTCPACGGSGRFSDMIVTHAR